MFIQNVRFQAHVGKLATLSDALIAENTPTNPIGVARRVFGPAGQIALVKSFPEMAAYETWLQGFTPNPAIQSLCASIAVSLWEVRLAPVNLQPANTFVVRNTFRAISLPALRELLAAVEQRQTEINAAGGSSRVWLNVFGESRAVAVVSGYRSMAEVEQARAARSVTSSNETLAFTQRIAPLIDASAEGTGIELFQILTTPALPRVEPVAVGATRA